MEVLKWQTQVAESIERLLIDFKMDGPSRRTEDYLHTRLMRLDALWRKLEEEDILIERSLRPTNSAISYFANNVHSIVEEKYEEKRAELHDALSALESQESTLTLGSEDKVTSQLVNIQKSSIISFQRLLDQVKNNISTPQPKAYYDLKSTTIRAEWTKICAQYKEIKAFGETHIEDTYKTFFQLQNECQDVLLKLLEQSSTPCSKVVNACIANNSLMRLPKSSTLRTFSGNYLDWTQFNDLFIQLIHSQNMENAQKLFYLKSHESGEAAKLIQHLKVSDSNYRTAWELLEARYNNQRLLVSAWLNKLLTQPSIQNESVESIKRLHDTTNECLLSLKNMNIDTKSWDPILIHILIQNLDKESHRLYEQSLTSSKDFPKIAGFVNFLETRLQMMGAYTRSQYQRKITKPMKVSGVITTNESSACPCKDTSHNIFKRQIFHKMSTNNRLNCAKESLFCINCLKPVTNCPSRYCCKCFGRYNTLLYMECEEPYSKLRSFANQPANSPILKSTAAPFTPRNSSRSYQIAEVANTSPSTFTQPHRKESYVFLGTVIINVANHEGTMTQCRAILDSESKLNFISKNLARNMNLFNKKENVNLCGIGNTTSAAHQRMNIRVLTRHNKYITNLDVYILPQITAQQPSRYVDTQNWLLPSEDEMADPEFYKPRSIDVLIGAELFCTLIQKTQIKINKDLPILQATKFGWVVFGRANTVKQNKDTHICGISSKTETQLQQFCEFEKYELNNTNMTPNELACERHFLATTTRDSKGKFMVEFPFLHSASTLGNSYDIAQNRFWSLEKRLAANIKLKQEYVKFMKEYYELGHMELVERGNVPPMHYFMPHHCVLRPSSTTSKLRIVFDGSCKTSNNVALNEILHIGPTVQEDLLSVILRFRLPKYVFTSDIHKMYRQIWANERDQNFQLILWRESPTDELKIYRLRTVTYGTRPALFLATRCLKKLAEDERVTFPLGAKIALNNFYVDNLMAGSNTLQEALQMQQEVQELLSRGGFQLRKWCANNSKLLTKIPTGYQEIKLNFDEKHSEAVSTLDFSWYPTQDHFRIKTHLNENLPTVITKRNILMEVAKVFDPLGLVSPVIITARILIQNLWILKLDWDTEIPSELQVKWLHYRNQLKSLESLHIPRHIMINADPTNVQLHAFSHASQKAYGACAYIRSSDKIGNTVTRLLCSRSKLAPAKTITLTRLELCAATLMASLVDRVIKTLKVKFTKIFYWTDSTIVLSWIKALSTPQEIFVANRVLRIQQCSGSENWQHICTKLNPADLISRGMFPEQLLQSQLWLNGPAFLNKHESHWPFYKDPQGENHFHQPSDNVLITAISEDENIVKKVRHNNSFVRLQQVLAFVLRFSYNCKNPTNKKITSKPDVEEMENAMNCLVKSLQADDFQTDYQELLKTGTVARSSKLSCLAPFLHEGIVRVGGRLHASSLKKASKHPIVLSSSNPIVKLLIEALHRKHLHAGATSLLAITRQRFWPLNGKNLVGSIVRNCLLCAKAKSLHNNQMIGSLPQERVQPTKSFTNVAVHFCGPFHIHYNLRGKRPTKAYLVILVGFAVKAVHLELVTELTTAAFIGALKRFIARRGCPLKIFCDNATNFIGAKNGMLEIYDLLQSQECKNSVIEACSYYGIQWCPVPPRSSYFGELWEAAVKSAKHHLSRVLNSARLSYEELNAVVAEVEAVLNSRPLTPMSCNPNDFEALTPGHFLIGQPLTAMPEIYHERKNISLLKRWELVKFLKREFWRRWSTEYLEELQNRYKWKQERSNIKQGSLVLLKDDNIPPLQWRMARVINTIKGADNLVRVVELKTTTGVTQRAIQRVCPLPIETDCIKLATNSETSDVNRQAAIAQARAVALLPNPPKHRIRAPSSIQLSNKRPKRKLNENSEGPSSKRVLKLVPDF